MPERDHGLLKLSFSVRWQRLNGRLLAGMRRGDGVLGKIQLEERPHRKPEARAASTAQGTATELGGSVQRVPQARHNRDAAGRRVDRGEARRARRVTRAGASAETMGSAYNETSLHWSDGLCQEAPLRGCPLWSATCVRQALAQVPHRSLDIQRSRRW
jgi:hypothetical protein